MAPNLIGSTFILAETAIANNDANNNSKGATATAAAATTTTPTNKAVTAPICPKSNSSNDRVPNQGEPAVVDDTNLMKGKLTVVTATTATMKEVKQKRPYKMEIVWANVMLFIILHSMAFYGLYLVFAENAYLELLFGIGVGFFGGMGITAGVHRLWSHRAYKAKLPLRIFLMLCQSLAFQNSIYEWTRDHRVHHKFTDTDADPHNSRRGFFFAHMGWLMCKKHDDVKEKGKSIDLSDLDADPVVVFQKKYYFILMPVMCFVVPALFPYFYMGSSLKTCFFVCSIVRYTISLHGTWLVNSAAHFYGMRPYDKMISSVESKLVASIAFGEGWHNYHHVFPWDYKAAELGDYRYNLTTAFLNFMARIGQAYDLKSVSSDMIMKRIRRTGDGTHPSVADMNNNTSAISDEMLASLDHDNEKTLVWGWDDKDVCEDDRTNATIVQKKDE